MHPHSAVEDYYRETAHPGGVGVDGWGAGPVAPGMFADRGASTRYDDTYGSRPVARPLANFPGLQLRNGVSQLARVRLGNPVGLFGTQAVNPNRMVLPGDRNVIPPSRAQVDQWQGATAGQIPNVVAGNGAVVAGYPAGGGAY